MTEPCPKCGSEDCKCVISPARLYKNKGTVMVLAIVVGLIGFAGVGHIYLGRVKRGVGFLVCTPICMFIGMFMGMGIDFELIFYTGMGLIFAGVGLFIWSVYDAKKLCNKYNDHLEAKGVPPW